MNIQVDYIQPKSADFPEKMCCTVTINNVSVVTIWLFLWTCLHLGMSTYLNRAVGENVVPWSNGHCKHRCRRWSHSLGRWCTSETLVIILIIIRRRIRKFVECTTSVYGWIWDAGSHSVGRMVGVNTDGGYQDSSPGPQSPLFDQYQIILLADGGTQV